MAGAFFVSDGGSGSAKREEFSRSSASRTSGQRSTTLRTYHLSVEARWCHIQARVQAFLLDRLGPHDKVGYLREYPEWSGELR